MDREGMGQQTVLIVEEDPNLATVLALSIEAQWPDVRCRFSSTVERLSQVVGGDPISLTIVDWDIRRINLQALRTRFGGRVDFPILVLGTEEELSSLTSEVLRGVTEVIRKPVDRWDFLSTASRLLKRWPLPRKGEVYDDGMVAFDPLRHEVMIRGRHVPLTKTEFGILEILILHADRVVTYKQMLHEIWNIENPLRGDASNIKWHVARLRRHLESVCTSSSIIRNVRGVGYVYRRYS